MKMIQRVLFSILLFGMISLFSAEPNQLSTKKQFMIEKHLKKRGISDEKVLKAMHTVQREKFVPRRYQSEAYDDNPLPIGYGQTISQPYIVALMTEKMELTTADKVLEIGTGSGYQAAILAEIVDSVFTIEIVEKLHTRSTHLLQSLGYKNIKTKYADGYYGWKEHGLYDAIIVTCASPSIPPSLIKQLKVGGVICIPVGPPSGIQRLILIHKDSDSEIRTEVLSYVRFVPLTRSGD